MVNSPYIPLFFPLEKFWTALYFSWGGYHLYVSVDFSVGHGCEVLAPWIEFHVESLTQMVPFHCDER